MKRTIKIPVKKYVQLKRDEKRVIETKPLVDKLHKVYSQIKRKPDEYRNKIENIKNRLNIGALNYEQAKIEAEPIIEEMNKEAKKIAKKYNKKFIPFKFSSLIR